jgi:hypothetical protein
VPPVPTQARDSPDLPLVRIGQGDFTRDIHPHDLTTRPRKDRMTTTDRLDLGFLTREPAAVYHAKASDHLSSHALADFRRCPLLFRRKELGLIPEYDTRAYAVGRAAHALILEGRDRFESEFVVGGPVNPRTGQPYGPTTKAFTEWAERTGKEAVSDADAAVIEQMAASVADHGVAADLLADGIAEGVVRAEHRGHRCQARIDWINPALEHGIVDLKTCDRLDAFEHDALAYGYVYQLAFYRLLVQRRCGVPLPVHIIAVEKREPYRCGVWALTSHVLDEAEDRNDDAMDELTRCRKTGVWPTRYEALRVMDRL